MTGFNIADAAGRGYKFTWEERRMLMHYGLWPVLLKVSSAVLILAVGFEGNVLRQGLVLLPAYFLEGWLVAIAIRYALLGEVRPVPLNNRDTSPEADFHRRCILGGVIIYLLTKLAIAVAGGMAFHMLEAAPPPQEADPSPGSFLLMLLAVGGFVWAFRLLWLYVPVVLGYSASYFLRRITGFGFSFQMLALWIICMAPLGFLSLAFAKMLLVFFPGSEEAPSLIYMYVLTALQAVLESVLAVLSSVAMAYGVRDILTGKPQQ